MEPGRFLQLNQAIATKYLHARQPWVTVHLSLRDGPPAQETETMSTTILSTIIALDPNGNDVSDDCTLGEYVGVTWADPDAAADIAETLEIEADGYGLGHITYVVVDAD